MILTFEAFRRCYVTLVNVAMMVLMLGSNWLYCIINVHEAEKLSLFLGLLTSFLEMFLTSENCFLTLIAL